MKIAVSILSSKYSELETIERINKTDADYIHVDVMDGKFVVNKSKPYEYLHKSKKKLNVHLMVSSPFSYISTYSVLNTETITLQSEIEDDLRSLIDYIHSRGLRAGLALKPETSVKSVEEYLKDIDEVLVLLVHPGVGGQSLIDSALYKIDLLKKIRQERKYTYKITVDGGVNDKTINKVKNADIVVSGSFICNSDNFQESIDKLKL